MPLPTSNLHQRPRRSPRIFFCRFGRKESLNEISEFKNFLFILGRNQIVSSLRKKLMETTSQDILETPEDQLLPDRQLEYKQSYHRILEAIEHLPPSGKPFLI